MQVDGEFEKNTELQSEVNQTLLSQDYIISADKWDESGVKYDSDKGEIIIINKQILAEKLEFGVQFEGNTIIIDKKKLARFLAIHEEKEKVKVKFT